MRLQLNNFTQKLDSDVLWFRRRRAYKIQEEKKGKTRKKKEKKEEQGEKEKRKKMEKKEINLIAAKSRLFGMKRYLETYNPMKYFLP